MRALDDGVGIRGSGRAAYVGCTLPLSNQDGACAMANIDNYLATITGDKRAALDELRRTIRSIVPRAEECAATGCRRFASTEG